MNAHTDILSLRLHAALDALRAGKPVIVADDHDRENEADLILAADRDNLRWLRQHAPVDARAELHLALAWCGVADDEDVPDPYYGGEDGFEQVLDLIEQASDALLIEIKGCL